MFAYCGLACDTCPIHIATLEQNPQQQVLMRQEIAGRCNRQYGMTLTPGDITDCDGCRAGGRLFSGCRNCVIRSCAEHRNVEICSYCPDFACDHLEKHLAVEPDARIRLKALRANAER